MDCSLPAAPNRPHTDLSKRKSGGLKEKEKKEEEDPNKDEDDHPFRVGACVILSLTSFQACTGCQRPSHVFSTVS